MENPSSWSKVTWAINDALYDEKIKELYNTPSSAISEELYKQNLIQKDLSFEDILAIENLVNDYNASMQNTKNIICGYSLPTIIEHYLIEKGIL